MDDETLNLTKAFLDRLANSACIMTSTHEGRSDGCFATYVTACSMEPPRAFLFSSKVNLTSQLIAASKAVALHIVDESRLDWLELFALVPDGAQR